VEAGHDRFSPGLVDYALKNIPGALKVSFDELMALGRVVPTNTEEPFCMTVLALKAARAANGVSELHGRVSREMWNCLWPDRLVDQVPIGHVTNGIHLLGWMKGTVRRFWRRKLTNSVNSAAAAGTPQMPVGKQTDFWKTKPGDRWESAINSPEFWQKMADPNFISDEELWALRYRL